MREGKEVLICAEIADGVLSNVSAELITTGRALSEGLGQPLSMVLIGRDVDSAARDGIARGADKVYTVDSIPFSETDPDLHARMLAEMCRRNRPSVILMGQTDMGRDLAPRVASKLETSACMDCIALAVDPASLGLVHTKPVYGGNAVAVWISEDYEPQVVTMRPRTASPAEPDDSRQGEILPCVIEAADWTPTSTLVETVKDEIKGIKLEEAEIIVAGGGGIGGSEGFGLLETLAQILGGTIATSRIPSDEGWMPKSVEVGQTAHMVSPKLYIAVGISGALQHLAGCSGSKCIVAINRDSQAHIFKEADFGVVGDYREILPPLIKKCKTLLAA